MNFTPFVVVWAVMAVAVGLIIVRRTMLGFNEDDSLHLAAGEIRAEKEQIAKAHSIDLLDRWGKILTIVTAVYGVALLALFTYQQLNK